MEFIRKETTPEVIGPGYLVLAGSEKGVKPVLIGLIIICGDPASVLPKANG
jgi:hypothetical protein